MGGSRSRLGGPLSCNTGVTPVREKREGRLGRKSDRPQSSPESPSWANRELLSQSCPDEDFDRGWERPDYLSTSLGSLEKCGLA